MRRWLAAIEEPADLRRVPRERLSEVASELREYLVEVGAEVGGHFAGSLGTVELCVALHFVFDTPVTPARRSPPRSAWRRRCGAQGEASAWSR